MSRAVRTILVVVAACAAAFVPAVVAGQAKKDMKASAIAQTPEWQKLKTLVGQWEGTMDVDGKSMPTSVDVRMTGDGSAMMHLLGKDTPFEMVTMIHPDGRRLLATHYCAAHNQPRMALVPSKAANQVAFQYIDGTNIAPGDVHMRSVVFTFTDADHHEEAWTSTEGPGPSVFKFTRKK